MAMTRVYIKALFSLYLFIKIVSSMLLLRPPASHIYISTAVVLALWGDDDDDENDDGACAPSLFNGRINGKPWAQPIAVCVRAHD
jgi:hypothetical protein